MTCRFGLLPNQNLPQIDLSETMTQPGLSTEGYGLWEVQLYLVEFHVKAVNWNLKLATFEVLIVYVTSTRILHRPMI